MTAADAWTPGDRFQLAALGDPYDDVTGRVRKVWTLGGQQHAHVTHDNGTITSWPVARLERIKPEPPAAAEEVFSPSVERAAELLIHEAETTGLIRDDVRNALAVALDVEEMAQFFNPTTAEPARTIVMDAWRSVGLDAEQLMALEEAKAIELASAFRSHILGGVS